MKKKKLYSRLLCIGITWGIISWILSSNYYIEDSFSIYTIPVFISNHIQENIIINLIGKGIYITSFLLSITIGGVIGYSLAFLLTIIFKKYYKEDN